MKEVSPSAVEIVFSCRFSQIGKLHGGDAEKPIVANKAEAVAVQLINQIARQVAARISVINLEE